MSKTSRRKFIQSAVALGAAGCVSKAMDSTAVDPTKEADTLAPLEPITPADQFFVTSSTLPPDDEWVASWRLQISGLDGDDVFLSLEELQSFDAEEIEHTLECISNSSPYAISNGIWTGIRFKTLLESFSASHAHTHIQMYCGEGYSTSLPVDVIDDGMALVWALNGEALSRSHGQPVRVLVPGRFGMKNPKWIEEIEMTSSPTLGYWEARGWSNTAYCLLHSWIHAPAPGGTISQGGGDLIGSAFCGSIGISKVEISDDEGESWQECEITYPGGANVWTLWRFRWSPSVTGMHTLMVRATNDEGLIQEDGPPSDTELDGYEALHRIALYVE